MSLPASTVAAELAAYYLTGDAAQGLASNFGPLAAIALGGFGGSPDPERAVSDHRYGFGPGRETDLTRARRVRAALAQLSQRQQVALAAVYGPEPKARIDREYGRGMAEKLAKRLRGVAPGLALLTEAARRGYGAAAPGAPSLSLARGPRRTRKGLAPAWGTPLGWLVATCLDQSEGAEERVERVRREAAALRAAAEAAYRVARDGAPARRRRLAPAEAPFVMGDAA